MTKAQIKTNAKRWRPLVEKMLAEHQAIEELLPNPDKHEQFLAVGMALGNLESELEQLLND